MVKHLQSKVKKIVDLGILYPGDLVIDIGSNDSTLLKMYPQKEFTLSGIDPTGEKFKQYYPDTIHLIPDFFSAGIVKDTFGTKKAKVITSIAMFYDLEEPIEFMRQVYDTLDDNGVWIFEQSYMPTMLDITAYDTICHEHLEYYGLKQIEWMADRVGFKIVNVELNDVNGGSFAVMMAKSGSAISDQTSHKRQLLEDEENKGLRTVKPYEDFKLRVYDHRQELRNVIHKIKAENKKLIGYGASTKGNVILQFCEFTRNDIPYIAEVNTDKFGCFTPGTKIPIISEAEAREMKPDYLMVLPWHFKDNIINKEREFLEKGGYLLMPLPNIEIINKKLM